MFNKVQTSHKHSNTINIKPSNKQAPSTSDSCYVLHLDLLKRNGPILALHDPNFSPVGPVVIEKCLPSPASETQPPNKMF